MKYIHIQNIESQKLTYWTKKKVAAKGANKPLCLQTYTDELNEEDR